MESIKALRFLISQQDEDSNQYEIAHLQEVSGRYEQTQHGGKLIFEVAINEQFQVEDEWTAEKNKTANDGKCCIMLDQASNSQQIKLKKEKIFINFNKVSLNAEIGLKFRIAGIPAGMAAIYKTGPGGTHSKGGDDEYFDEGIKK